MAPVLAVCAAAPPALSPAVAEPPSAVLPIAAAAGHSKIVFARAAQRQAEHVRPREPANDRRHRWMELFVVVYDRTGLRGMSVPGRAGKGLPEPMCAPEHVLHQVGTCIQRFRRTRSIVVAAVVGVPVDDEPVIAGLVTRHFAPLLEQRGPGAECRLRVRDEIERSFRAGSRRRPAMGQVVGSS